MLSRFWTLWLPLVVLLFQCGMEMAFSSVELAHLMSEEGPVEMLQWLAITGAFLVAVATLFKIGPTKNRWIFVWLVVAALGSLYVSGEEISWGQHFLNWSTPEYWSAVNDQNETNLHNTSSWLDQKPRLILLLGIVIGGIIFPLLQKFKPGLLPEKFAVIYPPAALLPVALLVIGPPLVQDVTKLFGIGLFERVSEVQELYMFYFVLLYLIVLRRRVLA